VTLLGIVKLVRPGQKMNAPTPMLVTLLGTVTLVRLAWIYMDQSSPKLWAI
jgi:hypothetical protein